MHDVIQLALERASSSLSEYESKRLIASYGIPVTREHLSKSADEAVAFARKIGYPVAVKACGPELMHKSGTGVMALHLTSDEQVRKAFNRVQAAARVELDGVLIQEMAAGSRELVLGLSREPQFGPCVMLGLGGVMTEILDDAVIRVAPFDRAEAEDMLDQLRSSTLLQTFRGEAAADRKVICDCLMALGTIGLENPAVREIDINPLIIGPTGSVRAVDALVILEGGRHAGIN